MAGKNRVHVNMRLDVVHFQHCGPAPPSTMTSLLPQVNTPLCAFRLEREFTLYLSTRWDMHLEREAFRIGAAPALKQILDSRGVAFGSVDLRSEMPVKDLQAPIGVDAVLVIIGFIPQQDFICQRK